MQAGLRDIDRSEGAGVWHDFSRAVRCTCLDDNEMDFRRVVREFRHYPDETPHENDMWKLALLSGPFRETNGQLQILKVRHGEKLNLRFVTGGECLSRV